MISPHGGKLINRVAEGKRKSELETKGKKLQKIVIGDWFVSDCEMIAIGGFSPLKGFMDKETVESVIDRLEIPGGLIWSIPIVLPVKDSEGEKVNEKSKIALQDRHNRLIAIMNVSQKFTLDKKSYCKNVYKTTDPDHPGVKTIIDAGNIFIAGDIELVNRPVRENIDSSYFLDPLKTREEFSKRGWNKIVAFQTRNPIHRAHEYLIKCAMEPSDGILIHPLVGETKADDIPAEVRMKCYEVLIDNYFNKNKTMLSVLPTAMRYAGPREAVHHMIMRKNYGCTHIIIGRDHAGVGDYYGTYEAQEFVDRFADRLEINPIKFEHSFYCKKCGNMASMKTCPHQTHDHLHLSGTKVRSLLKEGKSLPIEFSRPEVAMVLTNWAMGKLD
ncbi:MAG: sulfate adenylyltransferase [Candidatus Dadabacteria bacterium]|nr:sulfate adenylyltransferase [Candidatus Dadabacteria bacterium]